MILELLSPSTAKGDRTTKKDIYERTFHTPEYFCYDPATHDLEGWRLAAGARYQPIVANEHGWLWCEQLQLWLGTWQGTYLALEGVWPRFYDQEGRLVPNHFEWKQHQEEAARQRADAAHQRADAERQRADAPEAELAALKARLGESARKEDNGSRQ
jgi:hypothetical protein